MCWYPRQRKLLQSLHSTGNSRLLVLLLLLCIVLFSACGKKQKRHSSRGFYYWKTSYHLSAYEQQRLQRLKATKIYLRCFDVAINPATGKASPVGTVSIPGGPDAGFRYVPVVFITQEVLTATSNDELPQLAANINQLITSILSSSGIATDEIQIDCDWTRGSRDRYFRLLTLLRQQPVFTGKAISCTIRLHQIKYTTSSGIPPVDRGLLMCYNLGNVRTPGTHNSIFSEAGARPYLEKAGSYPLPLDVAFPIFSWSVLFRNNQFSGILRDITPAMIDASPLFTRKEKHNYTALYDTAWNGYEFRKGDVIRLESPEAGELQSIAEYLAARRKDTAMNVLLFHADSTLLSKHPDDELETIFDAFD